MITDHYSLAPKRALKQDLDDIVCLLNEYRAVHKPVTIMNYYRELPITSDSVLTAFDAGKYEITISELHMQVICKQLQTILCLDGCNVLAECSSLNIPDGTIVIYGFQYIDLHAEHRESFRLSVHAELVVDFRNERGKISGQLVDISVSGCRIKIPTGDLLEGITVILEIQIFDQSKGRDVRRSIAARVVHVHCTDATGYCCLEFLGTTSDHDLLSRYINQKQAVLIRNFRHLKVLPE
jgi:hypothetical protein